MRFSAVTALEADSDGSGFWMLRNSDEQADSLAGDTALEQQRKLDRFLAGGSAGHRQPR